MARAGSMTWKIEGSKCPLRCRAGERSTAYRVGFALLHMARPCRAGELLRIGVFFTRQRGCAPGKKQRIGAFMLLLLNASRQPAFGFQLLAPQRLVPWVR